MFSGWLSKHRTYVVKVLAPTDDDETVQPFNVAVGNDSLDETILAVVS